MKIEFEDRTWELDTDELLLTEAVVITGRLGVSLTGWQAILSDPDNIQWLDGLRCLYWLMLSQDGQKVPIGDVDFRPLKLADAYGTAYLKENPPPPAPEDGGPDPTTGGGPPEPEAG